MTAFGRNGYAHPGLVKAKTSLAIHNWTVEMGPLVEATDAIWQEIADALAKGRIEAAAPSLRRHLEYVSRQLANDLRANPVFRADGNYELGDWLPSALSRMNGLLGKLRTLRSSEETTP